jgi:hypothetical protein
MNKVDNNTANQFIAFLNDSHPEVAGSAVVEFASREIVLYEQGVRDGRLSDDAIWLIDRLGY